MKTKTFLFLCLFIGIGLTRLSAQTVKITGTFDYWQPVYCNGVQIDNLTGSTTFSGVDFYKDGELIWENFHNRGVAVSTGFIDENGGKIGGTGEVFTVDETDKQTPSVFFATWHFNLKGDQGSHYLGTMTIMDWTTGEIIVDKFVCVENGKNKK